MGGTNEGQRRRRRNKESTNIKLLRSEKTIVGLQNEKQRVARVSLIFFNLTFITTATVNKKKWNPNIFTLQLFLKTFR